jgi:hypothetical protein
MLRLKQITLLSNINFKDTMIISTSYFEETRRIHELTFVEWAVTGTLKGYDQLLNLVLDEAIENLRGWTLVNTLISCFLTS